MVAIEIFNDPKIIENSRISLNECRKLNKFTDLTLKSSNGEAIRVHKMILWSTSPYFQTMFNSNLKECYSNFIQLKNDITIQDLEIIIEYLYTGQAKVPKNRSKMIFEKANYFQLIELQRFCSKLLIQDIDDENCLQFLRYADLYSDNDLRHGSIEYIAKNGDKLLERYFAELSDLEFEAILSHKQIEICPEKKFICIINWVKLDLRKRSKYIERLLKNVDLLEISEDFMDAEIQSDDALRNSKTFSYTLMKMVAKAFRELKSKNNIVNDENQNNNNITVVVNRESPSISLSDALEMVNEVLTSGNVVVPSQRRDPVQLPQTLRQQDIQSTRERVRPSRLMKESRYLRRLSTASPFVSRTVREQPSRITREYPTKSKHLQTNQQKHIFLSYNYSIEKLNLVENKWEQKYLYHTDQLNYAIASFKHNIYLTGGLTPNSEPSNIVRYYSDQTNRIKRIPSMFEGRKYHKSIYIKDKIYSCGGKTNRGSVEYFDIGQEIWIRGAEMKKSRYCFGLSCNENSIYAAGGTYENTIERFDVREGEWHIIGKIPITNYKCKSLYTNNSLYCIDSASNGFVYDLRALKVKEEINPDNFIVTYGIPWNRYDVVELEGKIYGVFQNKFYEYNDGRWKNLRPSYLKFSIESINLCTL